MSDDRYELGRDRLKQFFGDIADELPDETEKDDRLFSFDDSGGVGIEAGFNVATWDGAVEIQTHGETEVSVKGPYKHHEDQEDAYIRITGVVDDLEHDSAASDVSLTLTVSDAQVLTNVLSEMRLAEPRVWSDEWRSEDVDTNGDGGDSDV